VVGRGEELNAVQEVDRDRQPVLGRAPAPASSTAAHGLLDEPVLVAELVHQTPDGALAETAHRR